VDLQGELDCNLPNKHRDYRYMINVTQEYNELCVARDCHYLETSYIIMCSIKDMNTSLITMIPTPW
jgi:hypothetical protein